MSVFNCKTHYLHDVIGNKGYLAFPLVEHLFPPKQSLKIWWKSKHFPWRYRRKHEWLFFSYTMVRKKRTKQLFFEHFAEKRM